MPIRASLISLNESNLPPGKSGLHSVQGAGSAGAPRVEIKMIRTVETDKSNISKPIQTPTNVRSSRPEQLRKLLRRKAGASISELEETFGWKPHTARAAISRLRTGGDTIERTSSSKGPVYRIASAGATK